MVVLAANCGIFEEDMRLQTVTLWWGLGGLHDLMVA